MDRNVYDIRYMFKLIHQHQRVGTLRTTKDTQDYGESGI